MTLASHLTSLTLAGFVNKGIVGKIKRNNTYQAPSVGLKFPLQMGIELESEISLFLQRKSLVSFPASLGNLQIPQIRSARLLALTNLV